MLLVIRSENMNTIKVLWFVLICASAFNFTKSFRPTTDTSEENPTSHLSEFDVANQVNQHVLERLDLTSRFEIHKRIISGHHHHQACKGSRRCKHFQLCAGILRSNSCNLKKPISPEWIRSVVVTRS